jgi:glycosyltransferase involved in cell wall biosynthesis
MTRREYLENVNQDRGKQGLGGLELKSESNIFVPGDKSFDYYKNLALKEGFPLVSLVVPTYNLQNYILETIESVKNQTLDPSLYEVLFVDDCSTDDTFEVTRNAISGLENMSSIQTKDNGGSYKTKNYGIRSSRGRFVMLLDGDDFLEKEALQATLDFMANNPGVRYSYSQHRKVDGQGKILYERKGFDFSRDKLLNFNFVGAVECFEKDLFEEIGGYRNVYVEDYDFALRASEILNDQQIKRNPVMLYNHRLHQTGKTSGVNSARESAAKVIQESLSRKEGIQAEVEFSGYNEEGNTCFEWKEAS